MAPIDPHSYVDGDQPLTTAVDLKLKLDFAEQTISGTARLHLASKASGELFLDTRDLHIESATTANGDAVRFELAESPDKIKGTLLTLFLHGDDVTIAFRTSPKATAVQWLEPSQTAGGRQPYVYTQCQPIYARSVFPCQDTPRARIKYTAEVTVPPGARVVMSAAHAGREEVAGGAAVERFVMDQPIPPYLFALAAGDIAHRDLGPRARVYAEPSVLDAAAYEFADTEKMIAAAESLFGPYEWERFDVLVMPPSFPYGGMENPRMTFLTPTLVAGDRSLVGVVAHELAHSWTGNLVTNATMDDFWLNEGWTVYAERRIQEVLEGPERYRLHATLGLLELQKEVAERFRELPQFTTLKADLAGVDPDEVYSRVPYEKGCLFITRLEGEVGRPAFDEFIQKYIAKFRFQAITTETFLEFLRAELPGVGDTVDLDAWVYGSGLLGDAPRMSSGALTAIRDLAREFADGQRPLAEGDAAGWGAVEWQIFLETLPRVLPHGKVLALDAAFGLSLSKNWELRVGFLEIAASSGHEAIYPAVRSSLLETGRMKYLRPLYTGLVTGGARKLAGEIFREAESKYHIIARQVIEGLLKKAGAL